MDLKGHTTPVRSPRFVCLKVTRRSGSATGSRCIRMASANEKIAVFAPMPRTSEAIAMHANSGLRRSRRMA